MRTTSCCQPPRVMASDRPSENSRNRKSSSFPKSKDSSDKLPFQTLLMMALTPFRSPHRSKPCRHRASQDPRTHRKVSSFSKAGHLQMAGISNSRSLSFLPTQAINFPSGDPPRAQMQHNPKTCTGSPPSIGNFPKCQSSWNCKGPIFHQVKPPDSSSRAISELDLVAAVKVHAPNLKRARTIST